MYTPLESTSLQALKINTPSFDGTETSFLATSTFVYTLFFVAIVTAAFYRYVVAGALRMQASEFSIRQSNQIIKQVTLGLLGVFSLFLLLFTVNKGLVSGDISLGGLKSQPAIQTDQSLTQPQAAPAPGPAAGAPTGGGNYATRVDSHNKVVARLLAAGINTNHDNKPCTEAQFAEKKPSCTSLAYLPEESIQMILKLRDCNCTVVVSGGTEPGHQTHREGGRPFDLRIRSSPRGSTSSSDPLYVFIKNNATGKLGSNSNCFERYQFGGFTFCDEKPPTPEHFHVY